MSTPFKMKGHTLPGPFQKKTWPPTSKPFDVEKDVIEKEEKTKIKGSSGGYKWSTSDIEKYTEAHTQMIQNIIEKELKKNKPTKTSE